MYSRTLLCSVFELIPFIKLYCPVSNFKSIQVVLLKLHKMIKDIKRQCSIQEP